MELKITSITGRIHDTSYGGYPYKVVVMIEVATKDYNKLPIIHKSRPNPYGKRKEAVRDLGSLVLNVNNLVYKTNSNIPAYNPSIDSNGSIRSRKGVKVMEFVYFFTNHKQAEALGFEMHKFKSGEVMPNNFQNIDLLKKVA